MKRIISSLFIFILSSTLALAESHGNALVHSREFRGQVYMMYQNHMSLYFYDKDGVNISNCYGECEKQWSAATLPADSKMPENYRLFERKDGTMQIAFKGKPLYLYSGDKKVGDINGDGAEGVWRLAKP